MAIKKIFLLLAAIISLGWIGSFIVSDTAFASPSDGKTCLLAPIGGLEDCPFGAGINDLSAKGYVLVPSGSQCFKGDERLGEDTPNKFSCNYDSATEKDGVEVFAAWSAIRDKAITQWKAANPGKGNPTEGQIYTFINTNVYAELNPQDEDIINQDCSQLTGTNKIRCEAIKSCVDNDPDKNVTNCTEKYESCVGDDTSEAKATECAEQLAAEAEDGESLCRIDTGVGWILCPILNTVANINDALYTGIIERFLQTPPISTDTSDGNALYQAWKMVRNIANVMFVLAFLLIIYSQLTSAGINNYGVKKMLPRLIVGAILVNTSYWLAAAAVDVSNIAGASIYEVLDGISTETVDQDGSEDSNWRGITTLVLGAGVGIWAGWLGLSMLLPFALSAIFFLFGLVATLAFRHAVLLILIVAAPIAAVAFMLPNTDKMSRSWWGLFKLLLYLYPVIAFVVGVGDIAAVVLFDAGQKTNNILLMLTGVAAPAFAIIAIPALVKATAGVLGKFGLQNPLGGVMNAAKSRMGNIGKSIDTARKNDRRANALNYANTHRGSKSRFRRATAFAAGVAGGGVGDYIKNRGKTIDSNYESAKTVYEEEGGLNGLMESDFKRQRENRLIATAAEKGSQFQDNKDLADKTDDELMKMANGSPETYNALKQQRHGALMSVADSMHSELSNDQVHQISSTGKIVEGGNERDASRAELAAAAIRIAKSGSFDERRSALEYMAANKGSFSEEARNAIVQEAIRNGDSNIYGAGFGNELVKIDGSISGAKSLKAAAVSNASAGKVSAEHMVQKEASTRYLVESVNESGDQKAIENIRHAANRARELPSVAGKVTDAIEAKFQRIGSQPIKGAAEGKPESPLPAPSVPSSSQQSSASPTSTTPSSVTNTTNTSTSTVTNSQTTQNTQRPTETVFSRDQLRQMGPENIQLAVETRGGMSQMSDGDILRIANTLGSHPVGQAAKIEVENRNLITQSPTPNLPKASPPKKAGAEDIARQLAPDSDGSLTVPHSTSVSDTGVVRQGLTARDDDAAERMHDRFTK